jgi:hypothetical protein
VGHNVAGFFQKKTQELRASEITKAEFFKMDEEKN